MKLKIILMCLMIVPTLLVSGCGCKDGNNVVEYSAITQQEMVTFLNEVEDGLDVNGYIFGVNMSIPMSFSSLSTSAKKNMWPDTSGWEDIKLQGYITNKDDNFEAKYFLSSSIENATFYVQDNVVYKDDGNNKYKATFNSYSDLEESGVVADLPDIEGLLDDIALTDNTQGGLSFEKGHLDGNDYYHIYGEAKMGNSEDGMSLDMTLPIEIYLTFNNNRLVSYQYKTMVLFVMMECEVEIYDGEIQFPGDFHTYIENKNAVIDD